MKLNQSQKRIGLATLGVVAMFCHLNNLLEWGLFKGYDKLVMLGALGVLLTYYYSKGPNFKKEEQEDMKD